MTTVTGVVVKRRVSKSAKGTDLFNLCVRDGNGAEEWFGFGWKDPGVDEGSAISFEYEQNGKWKNGKADTVKLEKNVPTQEQSAGQSNIGAAIRSTNVKERSIMTQTAYKVAPEIIGGMVGAGLIKFKSTNTDTGRESGMELYMALVHDVAQELFNKFADPLELQEQGDKADNEAEADPYDDEIPY